MNSIRTNKGKIDKTQQNSRCRLCNYRDGTINHIISEKSVRQDTTGNCAKNLDITIGTNGICTTQNPSKKKWCTHPLWLWDIKGSFHLGQTTRSSDSQQQQQQK